MRILLCLTLASAHRAAATPSLQAEAAASPSWLVDLEALRSAIPQTMSAAMDSIKATMHRAHSAASSAWSGAERTALSASQGPAKFAFLLEDEEKSTVQEALQALKGLETVGHDVEASIESITHHAHTNPSSFLETEMDKPINYEDEKAHIEKLITAGQQRLGKLHATMQKLNDEQSKVSTTVQGMQKKFEKASHMESARQLSLLEAAPQPEEEPEESDDQKKSEAEDTIDSYDEDAEDEKTADDPSAQQSPTADDDDPVSDPDDPALLEKDLRTHPSSLVQTGDVVYTRPWHKNDKADEDFENQFRAMDDKLKQEIAGMAPKATEAASRYGSSLLQTGYGTGDLDKDDPIGKPFRDLADKARTVQRKLDQDLKDMEATADSPELTGPDVGQQTRALLDSIGPALGPLPTSLLQEQDRQGVPDDEEDWTQKMRRLGDKTSWAELANGIENTRKKAEKTLQEFHQVFPNSPESFVEVDAKAQTKTKKANTGAVEISETPQEKLEKLGETVNIDSLEADIKSMDKTAKSANMAFHKVFPESPVASFAEVSSTSSSGAQATAAVTASATAAAQSIAMAKDSTTAWNNALKATEKPRERAALLEKKANMQMDAVLAKLNEFGKETSDDIEQLHMPHTTIAAALQRARKSEGRPFATSLLQTGDEPSSVIDITAQSQLDALQSKQRDEYQSETSAIDTAYDAVTNSRKPQQMPSLVQTSMDSGQKSAEDRLQAVANKLQTEVAALKGETDGATVASSFAQTRDDSEVQNYDQLDAKLSNLESSLQAHIHELQGQDPVRPSSFAEVGSKAQAMAKAMHAVEATGAMRSRMLTAAAARDLEAALGIAPDSPESVSGKLHAKQAEYTKKIEALMQKANEFEQATQEITGIRGRPTEDQMDQARDEQLAALSKVMGRKEAEESTISEAQLRSLERPAPPIPDVHDGEPDVRKEAQDEPLDGDTSGGQEGTEGEDRDTSDADADTAGASDNSDNSPEDDTSPEADAAQVSDDSSLLQTREKRKDPLVDATVKSIDRMTAATEKARESPDAAMDNAMASLQRFQKKIADLPETYGREFKHEVLSELPDPDSIGAPGSP